jgi:ABC-type amino acid transport substrate-binding protein
MLAGFHTTGKFQKVASNLIEMTPNNVTSIPLDELNKNIAEQKGVTIADLALKGEDGKTVQPNAETTDTPVDPTSTYTTGNTDNVLTDEALAAQYRSQADAMFKEAKRLREQAEELVPTKRKSKSTVDG